MKGIKEVNGDDSVVVSFSFVHSRVIQRECCWANSKCVEESEWGLGLGRHQIQHLQVATIASLRAIFSYTHVCTL